MGVGIYEIWDNWVNGTRDIASRHQQTMLIGQLDMQFQIKSIQESFGKNQSSTGFEILGSGWDIASKHLGEHKMLSIQLQIQFWQSNP